MKIFCDYHPTVAALWSCPECDSQFCSDCVSKRVVDTYGKKKAHFFCPKCNVNVERISIGNIIEPFWTRLHKIFLYPFKPAPLVLMIALSFLTFIYDWPLLGMWIRFIAYGLGIKYGFAILRRTAQGRFSAPKINAEMVLSENLIVIKQIGIYLIGGLCWWWVTSHFGMIAGVLFLAFLILFAPAMIIMLAATESLAAALNPVLFVSMVWRIGWSYFLMYLFLILLLSAPGYLGQFIFQYIPGAGQRFLLTFTGGFYAFVAYHLMGYVLLQYHEEIGYEVDVEEDELVADGTIQKQAAKSEILNRVDILIQDGKTDAAIALIREENGGPIADIQLAERYYRLLSVKQLIPEMLEHAKTYLDLLLKQKAGAQVVKVYQDCMARDAGFMPSAASLLKIAGFLNDSGKAEEAVQAYHRFIKANPKNNQVPRAYFLAAGVIHEKLKNREKAAGILNAVIRKYPQHEIVPYAQRYLKQMTSLRQGK